MRSPSRMLNGVVAALCLIALCAPAALGAEKPTTTITGIVKRAEVYGGKVRSVYIQDAQEGEFLVVRSTAVGKELLRHVGAKVRATGYVKKTRPDSDFTYVIDVLRYEIDPSDEPPPTAAVTPAEDG